ncbi:hypothetical protein [Streptomyces sp. NPDC006510]|uniref:hypothetical protein n=1 Tax=Streptomyces sp. NPDC006510 TaxID=3155600 RepID=UPI0033BBAC20
MPGTDFMVVDFATGEPLPLGERGGIVVRGQLHPDRRRPARLGGDGDGRIRSPGSSWSKPSR